MKPKCKHCKEELGDTLMEILLHEQDCLSNPHNKRECDEYTIDMRKHTHFEVTRRVGTFKTPPQNLEE